MRYLVTGATGFVGGRLVRRLVADGHRVVAVVRDPARAGDLAALGVDVQRGDITDKASLRAPMTGVDGVYHVAGWYKVGNRGGDDGVRINIDGTRNVLETMRDFEIPKGVYTSSLAVFSDTHGRLVDETYRYDGPHLSEYDRTKWVAHYGVADPLVAAGLPLVTVQPGVIYGPGDASAVHDTFVQYLRKRLPAIPKGTAFCWTHIDDAVEGHVLAMEQGRPGESYIIAGPPHPLAEAMAIAERITGVPAPRVAIPPAVMRGFAGVMGVLDRVLPVPEAYTGEYLRVNAGATYLGDNSKARRELGYAPRSLEEGLKETLRWEMAQLGMTPPGDPSTTG